MVMCSCVRRVATMLPPLLQTLPDLLQYINDGLLEKTSGGISSAGAHAFPLDICLTALVISVTDRAAVQLLNDETLQKPRNGII